MGVESNVVPQNEGQLALSLAAAGLAAQPHRGHIILEADGRRLSYLTYGQQDLTQARAVLIFLHGVPSSACEAASLHSAAAEAGVAVISVDRPGIGESSPHPNMSLMSFSADLGFLVESLGLKQVALVGESGGGPYAAAAAAALDPARVAQLHLVAPLGPLDGALLTTLPKGFDRTTVSLLQWRMWPLAWVLHRLGKYMVDHKPHKFIEEVVKDVGPPDKEVLTTRPEVADLVLQLAQGAYQQGVGGVLHDYQVLASRWMGVDLGKINCKVGIWHGTLDYSVPASHGKWYADNIPGSTLQLLEGEGHATIAVLRGRELIAEILAGG